MLRTRLYSDPHNLFLHDLVLESCRRHPGKTALVDASCGRRFTYAEYGEGVESPRRRTDFRRREARRRRRHLPNTQFVGNSVSLFTRPNSRERSLPCSIPPTASARSAINWRIPEPSCSLRTARTSKAFASTDCPICAGSTPRASRLRAPTLSPACSNRGSQPIPNPTSHPNKLLPRFLIRAGRPACRRASCSRTGQPGRERLPADWSEERQPRSTATTIFSVAFRSTTSTV